LLVTFGENDLVASTEKMKGFEGKISISVEYFEALC